MKKKDGKMNYKKRTKKSSQHSNKQNKNNKCNILHPNLPRVTYFYLHVHV